MYAEKQLFVDTLNYTAAGGLTTLTNTGIPRDLPLIGLVLRVSGRLNITGAGTAVNPEGPFYLIRKLRVYGRHARRGVEDIVNMEGGTLVTYGDVHAETSMEKVGTALGTAVGNYDFTYTFPVWFSLAGRHVSDAERIFTSLNGLYYPNNLQLEVTWGGVTDLVAGAAGNLFAFGLGTGVPSVTVHRVVGLVGVQNANFRPALIKRIETPFLTGNIAANGNNLLLTQLNLGNSIARLVIKAYGQNTVTGIGPASLQDVLLTRLYVKQNGNSQHDSKWIEQQQRSFKQLRTLESVPKGYNHFDFVTKTAATAYETSGFAATGQRLELFADVVPTGIASPAFNLIQEEILPAA